MGDSTHDSTLDGSFPEDLKGGGGGGGGGGTSVPLGAEKYQVMETVGGFPRKQGSSVFYFRGSPLGLDYTGLYKTTSLFGSGNLVTSFTASQYVTGGTSLASGSGTLSASGPVIGPKAYCLIGSFTTTPATRMGMYGSLDGLTPNYFNSYVQTASLGDLQINDDYHNATSARFWQYPALAPRLEAKIPAPSPLYLSGDIGMEYRVGYNTDQAYVSPNIFNHSWSATGRLNVTASPSILFYNIGMYFYSISPGDWTPISP